MAAREANASAIEACYDAAFEFDRWPGALQKLADSLGATSCALRTRDQTHPFRCDQRHKTVRAPDSTEHAEFTALWHERIGNGPNPLLDRPQLLAKPPISFTVEDEITTPEERRILPYYNEIARPGNREWWASICVMVKNRSWCVPLYRDARRGPFRPSEANRFLRVAPDLIRIISVAEKAWDISLGSSLAALDRLNCAAALLDCRGYVTRVNEHADALFGSGLVIRHRRIHAIDRASDARLQGLVGAAVSSPSSGSLRAEPVVITRNGSPWLLVEIVPMTSFAHDLFNGGDSLLYFTALVTEQAPSERLLSQTFQLTAAEARLASRLATGEGIGAASAGLAIGRETARTQLRAVFAKTGTRRQAELTALLSRLRIRFPH
ncbi:helix-turn-helix transcriptional regulator [Mesorhizobium sp. GbtcB19]|uniref:helix-turn-helix transcriptional regulator n=1 Tax=Mesorhizobium sp. GbtcB19 TaxID=2824764 RepID=UPI001C2F9E17|nr:helix-turn-helix transcriptional regulator [Mesorhizobium sp. GbtcB19]